MIKDYWGELANGRLPRLRFAILWVVLIVGFAVLAMLIGVSIGIAEKLSSGSLSEVQAHLREKFSIPAIVAVIFVGLAFLVAKLNIIAKRARDIGLPGWISAFVLAGLVGTSAQFGSTNVPAGGLGTILLVILALVPTNALKR